MRTIAVPIFIFLLTLSITTSCLPNSVGREDKPTVESMKSMVSVDCQNLSSTTEVDPSFARGVGRPPAWAIFTGIGNKPIIKLSDWSYSEKKNYGTAVKVLWVVEKSAPKITITGVSIDGTPLWFNINNSQDIKQPVLDPNNPPIPGSTTKFVEFPSQVYIPKAGCYAFEVKSQSTSWTIAFQVTE